MRLWMYGVLIDVVLMRCMHDCSDRKITKRKKNKRKGMVTIGMAGSFNTKSCNHPVLDALPLVPVIYHAY